MDQYLGFLKRRFLWALAGLVVFFSYQMIWGAWFVRTLTDVTGLTDVDPLAQTLTPAQWIGLIAGSLVVMSPAIAGFLAYMVAWIGWPGRPVPRRRRLLSGLGMAAGIAVVAFFLVGMIGNYWPPANWRGGLRAFAQSVDFELVGTEWVGDMYVGLGVATVGLYAIITLSSALLPADREPGSGWLGRKDDRQTRGTTTIAPHASSVDPASGQPIYVFTSGGLKLNPPSDGESVPEDTLQPARHGQDSTDASGSGKITGIWWPYAAGGAVLVLSLVTAIWPHLT
ncbi:hypothetical protein F7P69_17220 [Cellulosimicrobium funkei]|nr:hypothetical protein [Cellulosimicrobium funkei]